MEFLGKTRIGELGYGEIQLQELMKALQAGSATDSVGMTGGRALIPQDIENTLVNALAFSRRDFKLMNLLKTQKVTSPVHEYTRRNEVGDESAVFVQEGGESRETNQVLARITKLMKYLQTYREITLQMRVATTLEDAEASEKEGGTLVILKGVEWGLFHADKDIVSVQFDSVNKQVLSDATRRNLVDLRGKDMSSTEGEAAIIEIARQIFENGGSATHSFMPGIVAADIQKLIQDRIIFPQGRLGGPNRGRAANLVVESYPTPFSGDILVAGDAAGPDKFCKLKVKPTAGTDPSRPDAPTISLGTGAKTGTPGFVAATAGTYYYTVFAVNEYGISDESVADSQAVTADNEIIITITPAGTGEPATGFIICRSKKDAADSGVDCREFKRVAAGSGATTVWDDNDADLPGTGEILVVSNEQMQPSMQWDQFMPMMKFDLFPATKAIIPFLMILFGSPDVKVPWYHGVIKNIGYASLGWY